MVQLQQLVSASLAQNTKKTYAADTQRYLQFCSKYGLCTLPAHKHTVAFFAAALSRHLSPGNVQVYLAAVGAIHRQLGLRDPTRRNPTLKVVLQGLKRTAALASTRPPRLPVNAKLLRRLLPEIQSARTTDSHDRAMLQAALLFGFFGFLRISEFTVPSRSRFDPRLHSTVKDIQITQGSLTFRLKHSKTDQLAKGTHITLGPTNDSLCPVTAIRRYIAACRHTRCSHDMPLFHYSSGHPLTRARFLVFLRKIASSAGLDPIYFNTHSLRIGAATSAAKAGLPPSIIQHLGRWRSSCYQSYIRCRPAYLRQAAATISRAS